MPQVYRVDPSPVMTTAGNAPVGADPALLAVAGATIGLYSDSAGTVLATAYADQTGAVACPVNAQVTLPGSNLPRSTAGPQGQFGFWLPQGLYYYRVTTAGGVASGPFPLQVGTSVATIPTASGPLQYFRTKAVAANTTLFEFASASEYNSQDFNFTAQNPNVTLSAAGGQVIPLSPMPLGLLAGNTLYISDGANSEAVAISAVGAASVTVTCVHAHTGATWTIASATAGIQEAIVAAGAFGSVKVAVGYSILYSPVVVPGNSRIALRGRGQGITILLTNGGLSGYWIDFPVSSPFGGQPYINLGSFSIIDLNGSSHTSGAMIRAQGKAYGVINDIEIENGFDGLVMDTCPGTVTLDSLHIGCSRHAIYVTTNGVNYPTVPQSGCHMSNIAAASSGATSECLKIEGPTSVITVNGSSFGCIPPATGNAALSIAVSSANPAGEITFGTCVFDAGGSGVKIAGDGVGYPTNDAWIIIGDGCEINGSEAGVSITGMVQNVYVGALLIKAAGGSANIPVSLSGTSGIKQVNNIQFRGNSIYGTGAEAFVLNNASNIQISDVAVGLEGSGPLTFMVIQNTVSAVIENCNMAACVTAKVARTGGASWAAIRVTDFSNAWVFADLQVFANGSIIMCADGTIANPVANGGTGCLAKRLNGAWVGN